ncbi:MAG: hypothetical protein HDR33_11120 [Treponema sp.]|nr:hypothetical protein [Treponema sp.]
MKPFLGEGKPSTSEAGVSPLPNPHPFPARLGVAAPRPAAGLSPASEFSSKTRGIFVLQKYFRSLSRCNFGFQKHFCGFPDAILAFKSTFVASLAQFQRSKVFSWLSRRVFMLQKFFRCFPGSFSAFKSSFVAFSAQFRYSKVLSLLSRNGFGLQKHFFHSVQTKINTLRSFYGKSN